MSTTSRHALHRVFSSLSDEEEGLLDEPGPRLLGSVRGIVEAPDFLRDDTTTEQSPDAASMWSALLSSTSESPAVANADEAKTFDVCRLKPGVYFYEDLCTDNPKAKHCLRMKLHAAGHCEYDEKSQGNMLKTTGDSVFWSVEDSTLVLTSRPQGAHSFLLRERRGKGYSERRVARVHLPVHLVLDRCAYWPFPQHMNPFPEHIPLDASRRIFGIVDPDSPVIRGLRCQPHRVPYHAFEYELRRHGLPCDEILSDFHFLDRDHDNQISLADMRFLQSYGNPAAAPEVLEELRIALVHRYGGLAESFAKMSAGQRDGKVNLEAFEAFLAKETAEGDGENRDDQKLNEWMSRTTVEDRVAVFASLNPNSSPHIDLEDFMSLNLHSAMLVVRRLEHFQSWLFEEFGRTNQVFARVFAALDTKKTKALSCERFTEGAQALGYPCKPATIRSLFDLLDRNFDGEVSLKKFQRLKDFNTEEFLRSLEDLKSFAEKQFGGLDECFQQCILREKMIHDAEVMPKRVSFVVLQKVCNSAGFSKIVPNADLKMLFLFFGQGAHRKADGYITSNEWNLLKGLSSRAITGSPARLRRILDERYGGMDQAFLQMHTSWLRRALHKGLVQEVLASMACGLHAASENSSPQGFLRAEELWCASRNMQQTPTFPAVGVRKKKEKPNTPAKVQQQPPCVPLCAAVPQSLPALSLDPARPHSVGNPGSMRRAESLPGYRAPFAPGVSLRTPHRNRSPAF